MNIQEIKNQAQILLDMIQQYENKSKSEMIDLKSYFLDQLIEIPSGSFIMGDEDNYDSSPKHKVDIVRFFMQETPVTQFQWKLVMGNLPEQPIVGDDYPVVNVNWYDVQKFIKNLNHLTDSEFRLPSESEWEYACANAVPGWNTSNCSNLMPVRLLNSNIFGLFDMLGNVWEWCEDDWHDNYQGSPTDGRTWVDSPRGDCRVLRGGSWYSNARNCRVSARYYNTPDDRYGLLGFRLAHS